MAAIEVRRLTKRCSACSRRYSGEAAFCPFDGERLAEATADPIPDDLVGVVVDGRYEVLEVIGQGGMGRVYKVRHAALDRRFAMKVLREDLAKDPDLAARFIQEAKATASVRHRNVVQVSDFGVLARGAPYLVMDLVPGESLRRRLRGGVPALEWIVEVTRQLAMGLGAAHEAGVIHRDLKPDNVLLAASAGRGGTASGAAKGAPPDVRIVDFGAAKVVGVGRTTRAGVVFGTPHYMSPEQAQGHAVDHRADVYALGVILYEMLAGKVPFEGDTYMSVLTQHMFAAPVPPSRVDPLRRRAPALERITLRCLSKRPKDRYATMDDLVAALDSAQGPGALGRVPPRRWHRRERAPSEASSLPAEVADSAHHEPWRGALWVALAILAPVVVTLVGWVALDAQRRRATPSEAGAQGNVARATRLPASVAASPTGVDTPPDVPAPRGEVAAPAGSAGAADEAGRAVAPPIAAGPATAPVAPKSSAAPAHPPVAPRPSELDDVGDPFAPGKPSR